MPPKSKSASKRKAKPESNDKMDEEVPEEDLLGLKPHPPQLPETAFFKYRMKRLPELKKEMRGRTVAAITETMADEWSKMSARDKRPYEDEATRAREKYDEALKEYQENDGSIAPAEIAPDDEPLKGMYYNSVAGAGKLTKLAEKDRKGEKGRQRVVKDTETEKKEEEEEEDKPQPPKKPQTAFFMYKSENMDAMKKKNSRASASELSAKLAEEWENLTKKDQKKYEDRYKKEKEKYDADMKEFEAQNGKVQKRKSQTTAEDDPSYQKPTMNQRQMKVRPRPGTRPAIYPDEGMVGNKPRTGRPGRSSMKDIDGAEKSPSPVKKPASSGTRKSARNGSTSQAKSKSPATKKKVSVAKKSR